MRLRVRKGTMENMSSSAERRRKTGAPREDPAQEVQGREEGSPGEARKEKTSGDPEGSWRAGSGKDQ